MVSSWASAMSLQIPDTYCLEQNNTTHSCKGNNTCWEGYDELSLVYILSVPMTIALAVSQFFQYQVMNYLICYLFFSDKSTVLGEYCEDFGDQVER